MIKMIYLPYVTAGASPRIWRKRQTFINCHQTSVEGWIA